MVRVYIPHHMDVFPFYVALAELIILIGVAIWQASCWVPSLREASDLAPPFLGLLSGLGGSRKNIDYFSNPRGPGQRFRLAPGKAMKEKL